MNNAATLHHLLAAPALRKSLTAMVRKRVPASDAEDVAQTILCDALAAPAIPTDPEEMRRFVVGIARHKVADFHRGARRRGTPANDDGEREVEASPAPIEAHLLLSRIAASVAEAPPREQETLDWLLREHEGEQLQTIAEESGVPAPAVRQRVSRLRRVLRAQWAVGVLLLLGAGGIVAERMHSPSSSITADPAGDPVASAALVMQGRWHVESLTPASDASPAVKRLAATQSIDVRVSGRHIELALPTYTALRTLQSAEHNADGSLLLTIVDEAGTVQHITATSTGDRLLLTSADGRAKGTAVLVRR